MEVWLFLAVIAFAVLLVLWGRRVFRKHEEESIYEPGSGSDSHTRDPAFLEKMGDGFHGGSGGPGL